MDDLSRFETAKLRWMSGGDAPATALSGTDGQLCELALAGQFRQTCLRPSLPDTARHVPAYPKLALPLLAEDLRPIFRSLLSPAQSREYMTALIRFMAARGVMAHPFDWLPPRDTDGYPDIYVPLAKWYASEDVESASPDLSAETWTDLFPAERRLAFQDLRRDDPDAARDLLDAKAATVPAEERTRLVSLLATNLAAADQAYLEQLVASDRSGKVKTVARQLLARLGVEGETAEADELAAFLQTSKTGLLRRGTRIGLRPKLNPVQRRRAFALMESVSLVQLARAMDQPPDSLIAAWDVEEHALTTAFLECLAGTGTEDQILAYWARLFAAKSAGFVYLDQIKARLSSDKLRDLSGDLLRQGQLSNLTALLAVTGPDLDAAFADALVRTDHVRAILDKAAEIGAAGSAHHASLDSDIRILGLLLPAQHAAHIKERFEQLGVHGAHPILHPLTFNIGLKGPRLE